MESSLNLFKLIINHERILSLITSYLLIKDLKNLSETSKIIKKIMQDLMQAKMLLFFDQYIFDLHSPKNKAKSKKVKIIQTPFNSLIKMNIFNLPNKLLISKIWRQIPSNDKWLQSFIKEEKFIKEDQNIFFVNNNKDVLFINRTLLDDNLLISKSKNEFSQEEEVRKEGYEKLYLGNELTSDFYDFTDIQSLLRRQKDITSNLKEISKKKEEANTSTMEKNLEFLTKLSRICIILCHGGNFSFALFEKGICILHKSDHKYVTRKKAGQRQLAKDKCANIRSMGSQIRRENEKNHQIAISKILSENFEEIQKSEIILLQAPGINKLILFEENKPLTLLKDKIRSICLTAKKANFVEIEEIFKIITKAYLIVKREACE